MGSEARGGDTRTVIRDVITDFQFNYFSACLKCLPVSCSSNLMSE